MRLEPIEKPKGLLTRLAYFASRWKLGKVMTPMKVVFARVPGTFLAEAAVVRVLEGKLSIGAALQLLLQQHVAALNGCGFCVDIGRAYAVSTGLGLDKTEALADWRTSRAFSERERAALGFVEEATRQKRVSDETFAALRRHFDDRQIAEITWLNAIENYFNLVNLPLEIASDGLCAIAERRGAA
jgi:AhpD family alkylhydroperoxidase